MNKEIFDKNWGLIRSQTTLWWRLMAEFDLHKVDKSADKLVTYTTLLQVKYGYNAKQARDELARKLADFKAEQAKIIDEPANK